MTYAFCKGYATGNWTRELFVIATRQPTIPVTYTLRNLMDYVSWIGYLPKFNSRVDEIVE